MKKNYVLILIAYVLIVLSGCSSKDSNDEKIFTEEAPTNFKYMQKEVEVNDNGKKTIQIHRYHFNAPEGYNENKAVSYPLVISLYPFGFPNSEEALTIPEWTFGFLSDGSPYSIMPGENQPAAFQYSPICPPPYNREFGGPSAPDGGEWNSPAAKQMIIATIKELISKYNIDTSRIYLNGFSMGGAGVWYIAQAFYDEMGYPIAAISRSAGYTPTDKMLDANMFPDLYKSAIWYHVGENDDMALSWDGMGNADLAEYTYQKLILQHGKGEEKITQRTIGNGLTEEGDELESTMKEYIVDGKSLLRLSIYKNRGHENLCARNTDFVEWMYKQHIEK